MNVSGFKGAKLQRNLLSLLHSFLNSYKFLFENVYFSIPFNSFRSCLACCLYVDQRTLGHVCCPHKLCLHSADSYFSSSIHLGICRKGREGELCASFALDSHVMEQLSNPTKSGYGDKQIDVEH